MRWKNNTAKFVGVIVEVTYFEVGYLMTLSVSRKCSTEQWKWGGDLDCGAIHWEGTVRRRRTFRRKDVGLDFSVFVSVFTIEICGNIWLFQWFHWWHMDYIRNIMCQNVETAWTYNTGNPRNPKLHMLLCTTLFDNTRSSVSVSFTVSCTTLMFYKTY
jgi:hypothetical protein